MPPDAEPRSLIGEANAALRDVETFIERGTGEYKRTTLSLFAAGFTTFALLYCVQPILPVFSSDFGVSPATASLSLSVTTQCLAICMLVASSLSEVFGRKPVMVVSLFASSALMLGSALAPNWNTLLILRALAGIAFSGLPATAMAFVGEEMHPRSLGMAMGLYIGGTGLGALGGRLIVGVMTDLGSWRTGLFAIGLLAFVSSLVFALYLPGSRHFRPAPPRLASLALSFATHLRDPVRLLLFLEGFLLLGVYVGTYNYIGYRLLEPPYSFSQTTVGLIFGIALVGILSSAWVGDFAGRIGRERALPIAVALTLAGVLITVSASLWAIMGGLALMTFAFYGAHSVCSSWVGMRATTAKAQASSLYLFAYYTGSSIVGSLGGLAWQSWRWGGVAALCCGVLVLALVVALVLGRLTRHPI